MNEDIKDIFANNLKYYMNLKGENLTKLSDSINISYSTVSDWLHGKKMPRSGSLQLIADHYNVNISNLTSNNNSKNTIIPLSFNYNFFDTTMSAGALTAVDPFTRDDVEQIAIPDMIMGKYAGDKDIFVSRINGESMNNVLPNNSMVAVKKYDSIHELCDNDIVVFQDGGDMTVKRFHDNKKSKTIMFVPDSKDDRFEPILYRYEDIDNVKIIGKVIVYIVRL